MEDFEQTIELDNGLINEIVCKGKYRKKIQIKFWHKRFHSLCFFYSFDSEIRRTF